VHGNALKLKKIVEKLGGIIWGEDEASRSLYLCFPGTVRADVISTHRTEYPKPGKPVFHPASIQEDLRRRDFTVNAMAISLNEGSFGLLMDPLNGAADIEARILRLVSNYGFLEQPSLLIRATRYKARLGWDLDPKTQTRYENAKGEEVIQYLAEHERSRELEQIGHEEEGLKVLQALDAEGWTNSLFPPWTPAKADEEKLKALHDLAVELLLQGVHADMSAAQMQLLTAKLAPKDLTALKKLMLRPGFVEEWNSLDALAAGFAKELLAKENATPSTSFKLFTSYDPEAILWLGFASKDPAVRERFNMFLKVWPEARQRIPHSLMQEMRITPELATYNEIVQSIFLELIDGRLTTPEEIRAFLEPHSPPAPPPQVTIKRPRAKRGAEAKLKDHAFDDDEESEDDLDEDEDLDDIGGDEDEADLGMNLPKVEVDADLADEADADADEEEAEPEEPSPVLPKRGPKPPAHQKMAVEPLGLASTHTPVQAEKPVSTGPSGATIAAKHARAEMPQATSKLKHEPEPNLAATPLAQSGANGAKPAQLPAKETPVSAKSTKPVASQIAKKAPPAPVAAKGPLGATHATSKLPIKVPAKLPVKAPVKPPVKAQVKPSVKAPMKSPAKGPAKPAAKVTSKAAPPKSAPAKAKATTATNAKAGKALPAVKSPKPAQKKPTPKPPKKS
jgi:tRNA nucleotidyltransferase (CCA-adding enzyme)